MNIVNKQDGDKEVIDFVVRALGDGKVIVYPTETVYGLGCDATNKKAVKKIYAIKGKSEQKQLLVLVANLAMAKKYALFDKTALAFAKKYWPGALTLVLRTSPEGKKLFGTPTLGVRISSNPIAQALVKSLGKPLVSTSANLTGQPASRSGQEAMEAFAECDSEPDLILDAGKLKKSKGSTIVDCTGADLKIIRKGDLKI
jgi:L-threonylcarbamoyladenylate synthase